MDFEDDEEYTYKPEQKAFERAGPSGKLDELMSGAISMDGKRKILNADDRFLQNLDAISRSLSILELTQKDINDMIEATKSISNLGYKNVMGYILGYKATKGGREMNASDIQSIFIDILPNLGEDRMGITPPDVIRYARFWMKRVAI